MARGSASLDRSAVVRRYGDATRLATIWSIPIIAGLFAFAGDITELVAPEVAEAAAPLRIILVAMAIEVVTGRVSTTLLMAGRSMLTLVNAAASLGVAVALDLAAGSPARERGGRNRVDRSRDCRERARRVRATAYRAAAQLQRADGSFVRAS